MLLTLSTFLITGLLLAAVVLSWAGDVRRVGRATSAREVHGEGHAHAQRVRRMEARLRAERLRREATAPPPPAPPAPVLPDEARHRATLELPAGPVTAVTLRRQYRTLVVAYHPDRVAGLGHKLQALAVEETKALNEAYAYFKTRVGPDEASN